LAPEPTVLGLMLGCHYRARTSGLVNLSVADVGSLMTHTDLSAPGHIKNNCREEGD